MLESVIRQNYTNFKIVFVDDHSTQWIAETLKKRISTIRQNQNISIKAVFND